MKYIVMLGDGMADRPIEALGGKTPLEYADTPCMDRLAEKSEMGMVRTVPGDMSPGSDVANLSVLGYDPQVYYTGRSSLEALSIGVDMKDTDVAFRCNFVTLSEDDVPYTEQRMLDHSSGEISTQDCAVLLEAIRAEMETEVYKFYVGTSYRHLMIWDRGEVMGLVPPHDIIGKPIGSSLPSDAVLRDMMSRSFEILKDHPLNLERKAKGLNPANSIWFWGAGTRPTLSSFYEKNGKKAAMISAVDLLKGLAVGAGMDNIIVEGANGGLHTNYEGKAAAAVKALLEDGEDFVYIHLEAPDEMGHQGSVERKVQSIENLDKRLLAPVVEAMDASGEDYRLVVLPDHPTPICTQTHSSDPVPFMIFDSRKDIHSGRHYNEKEAGQTGLYIENGYTLMDHLFEK
ncbi:MAG TPA: cofactor-independent phosphoglycerate mutase [Candidatus Onthocola gallistercoris]|uniref:Cofactor-independent phosphoglycerate mutase n=1 Tax=Candidatus Onthocola gallistercoris TaxID=2840876 RepID=A0A9D1HKJ2_9FIRM|nr:cofactor-independent phosphoglycerate mutase [Candidatus Onthocola gallistercoris]